MMLGFDEMWVCVDNTPDISNLAGFWSNKLLV